MRTPDERPDGVIEGDVLIPLDELSVRAGEIDPARPALIYCRSGSRSAMAVAALRAAGYDAHNLAGGMLAWLERRPAGRRRLTHRGGVCAASAPELSQSGRCARTQACGSALRDMTHDPIPPSGRNRR